MVLFPAVLHHMVISSCSRCSPPVLWLYQFISLVFFFFFFSFYLFLFFKLDVFVHPFLSNWVYINGLVQEYSVNEVRVRVPNIGHHVSYCPLHIGILDFWYCYSLIYQLILPDVGWYLTISPIPIHIPIQLFKTMLYRGLFESRTQTNGRSLCSFYNHV